MATLPTYIGQKGGPSLNVKGFKGGLDVGLEVMRQTAMEGGKYAPSTLRDKQFKQSLKDTGISAKEKPGAFLGAYTARVAGDIINQETRNLWWAINHPIAMADKAAAKLIDPQGKLPRYTSAAIIGSVVTPAFALSGAYDPTNIAELGRPKGYKQNIPDPDDPTQSMDPATEVFERFMQGRQGRPLAYEKAKEEIPSLTKGRYANYMNFLYNEPAVLGSVKATSENLEGVPEARVFGYPVSIPTVTTLAGGIAGARIGLATAPRPPQAQQLNLIPGAKATDISHTPNILRGSTFVDGQEVSVKLESMVKPKQQGRRGVIGGLAGAAGGAILGVLTNQALAAKQLDTQLPMS